MPRILSIKKAFVEDEILRFAILDDMALLERFLTELYTGSVVDFDICGVSEDREWLVKGKTIRPEIQLAEYDAVFVFVHSHDRDFDYIKHVLKAVHIKVSYIYERADQLFHHAERLESLVKTHRSLTYPVKFPHQKHIDIKSYNAKFVPVEDIVKEYYRNLFLPIEVVSTDHRGHIKEVNGIAYAQNPADFAELIHSTRHTSDGLTFREQISDVHIYIVTIPDFRKEKIYTTLALIRKPVNGLHIWDVFRSAEKERKDIINTVKAVSGIAFTHRPVVYTLAIHQKRGVFIKSTNDLLFFAMHHPDFFFDLTKENGIAPLELFESLRYNP